MTGKLLVGVTDHMASTLEIERAALGDGITLIDLGVRTEAELDPDLLAKLDGLLVWTLPLTAPSIAHLHRCRIVVRYGVGFDKIDVAALAAAGIPFANNPDYGTEEVADTALAMILALQRRLFEHDARIRSRLDSWQTNILAPLHRSRGATIGVIGIGRIGTAVVNRLKPFGHTILGYDPYQPSGHEKAVGYHRLDRLDDLLAAADIVTLHCPLTDETRSMIDASRLARFKPGAILVNVARGQLVADLDAVAAALRSGQLAAAGFDVLPVEPPLAHPLIEAWRQREPWLDGRLLITPHAAFYSDQAIVEQRAKAAETVRLCLVEGRRRNLISPQGEELR